MEQRTLLLSRTRRGANKKSKGGNSKKDSKSQKPKKSKKNEPEAERISSRRPSKQQSKKQSGKPSKGGNSSSSNGGNAGRISAKQKGNRPENFKSCTATMITPKCILTTAACTGNSKNVNLFAKIGERQYGSDVSFCYANVKTNHG